MPIEEEEEEEDIDMNNDVRIHGYFSKPKGVHKQESLGKNSVMYWYDNPSCTHSTPHTNLNIV